MTTSQMAPRNPSVSFTRRHPKYYIDSADFHVMADKTLFRVHGFFFQRESSTFNKRLNPASPGDLKEGTNDNDPVILEDVTPEEFEKFLWVFYNPLYSLYDTSIEDWNCILHLADKWDFPLVKELAVRELHKKPELDLVDKMVLYQKYKVNPQHIVPLYAQLCARDTALTFDESKILGLEACVIINTARERLRAKPSDEGRSPLPENLEEGDVFREIETQMGVEKGSTAKFKAENPMMSLSVESPIGNGEKKSSSKFSRRGMGKIH